MIASPEIPWQQPGWREQASEWISSQLQQLQLKPEGLPEPIHIRAWSMVLRVPTRHGPLYFKAVAPALVHEAALTFALGNWFPHCVLTPLAVEPVQGWLLLPDGGARLRDALRSEQSHYRWLDILPAYAQLQIELTDCTAKLLALGAPDRRLAVLPGLYADLLQNHAALRIDQPEGIARDEYDKLLQITPAVARRCAHLAAYGLPESLHHGDFHDGNIFLQPMGFYIFDWGDCSLAHPFFSLRTVFVSLEISLGWDTAESYPGPESHPGRMPYAQLLDAYLAPWTHFAPLSELQSAYALSQPLSTLCSAFSWQRALSAVPETARADFDYVIPALMKEFLTAWE
jgi:hypothetical protein